MAGGCVILGVLFTMGRAFPQVPASAGSIGEASAREEVPQDTFARAVEQLEAEQKALKGMVESLEKKLQSYQQSAARRRASLAEIARDLEAHKIMAGLVVLAGPGLKVVMDDSSKQPVAGDNPGRYLIHDYHLRDVLSALWLAGAEAITINGERVINSTSVYCVGSTLLVNNTLLSPPYELQAIGSPDSMESRLSSSRSIQSIRSEARTYGLQFSVQKVDKLALPPYKGVFSPRYASIGGKK
ncbi:MAG: DUF881 domain-containing protein [Chloroflexi bacterium]|nr:DUF881 domain-containing protein [Chloroflexota bacterium]